MTDTISAYTVRPGVVSLKPLSFLGPDRFQDYRTATRGAVFEAKTRTNIVPRHAWPFIMTQLTDAGFGVEVDATAEGWIFDEAARAQDLYEKTESRIEGFQKRLAARGLALRDYQKKGMLWLANRHSGFLLDEQGTGKTIQAIAAIPENVGVIVVCPASLRGLWRDEILKWRPELRPFVLVNEAFLWPGPGEVFITSESSIRQIVALRPWPVLPKDLYLIADECQMFKGNNQRTASMQVLCAAIRAGNGWSIGLTGTPLMNHPKELFTLSLVFGCMRLAFGSWSEYAKDWNCKKGRFAETIWGQPSPRVHDNLARVSIRRTRKEVMPELPDKVYQTIPVDIKKRLYAQLDAVGKEMYPQLETWATSDKLPAFEKHSEVWALLTKAKIDDMLDWADRLEENEEPCLIFSMHLAPLERLRSRPGWELITGDIAPEKRTAIVKAFQGGDLKGLGISIKAGGTGLTLTRAAFELFVDLSYNPYDNLQAEDRACRYGQHRSVQVSTLVANHPLDRRVAQIIRQKISMSEKVV